MMACLCKILLLLTGFTYTFSQSIGTAEMENANDPSFYKNEPLSIQCNFQISDETFLKTMAGFGILFGDSDFFGCSVAYTPRQPPVASVLAIDSAPFVQEPSCQSVMEELRNNGGVGSAAFEFNLQNSGDYKCAVWSLNQEQFSDNTITVTELSEIPTSAVTATVEDGQAFYDGDTVDFQCSSTGGKPSPQWNYTKDGVEEGASGISFQASRMNEQVVLRCEDMSHEDWTGDESLTSYEATIDIYYLYAPATSKNATYNPAHNNELSCDTEERLKDDDVLTYTWSKNGEPMASEMDRVVMIEQMDNATSDQYKCEAMSTDNNLAAATITFDIKWDAEASTPIPPTEVPTDKPPKGAKPGESGDGDPKPKPDNLVTIIIIVVVVVLVVVGLIIVVVVIVKKRRDTGEVKMTGDNRATSDDAEKGKTDGTADKGEEETLLNKDQSSKPAAEPEKDEKE